MKVDVRWVMEVTGTVFGKNSVRFCEFSPVEGLEVAIVLIFAFLPFPESAAECDVFMRVGGSFLRC